MPKNMRFACFLVALCLVSLMTFGWPTGQNPKAAVAAGGAFARAANCTVQYLTEIGPIANSSTGGVNPPFALNLTLGATKQDSGQQSGISIGRPDGARITSASAPSVVSVTDHRMSAGPIPADCVTPATKINFSPTDAQAFQWTLLDGINNGDVIRWDFRQPNGTTYFLSDPVTLNFSGAVCAWQSINIASTAAASLLGLWEVRVSINGALITSDTFTISNTTSTVTLSDHRITGSQPPNGCVPPTVKTTYSPTDERVYQWTLVNNAQVGDTVRWQFVQPNGTVYSTSEPFTITGNGGFCFWASIAIAGQPPASLFGTWQVRVLYNNLLLLPTPDTFTISQNTCPTVNNISPSSGAFGGTVTINGSNFTGVTAVKFANNLTAQFNVVSATQITATVPANAVTGPITISKPSCADVQTSAFTILQRPVIEVTPASLNFGNVATGDRATRQLTIRNLGNASLSISSFTSNNPEFIITSAPPNPFGLIPGSSANFTISFMPQSAGTKNGTLTINSNDTAHSPINVALTGTGLAPTIEVNPTSLPFGDLRLAQTRDLTFTIRNTGAAPLRITSIGNSNGQFSAVSFIEKPSNAVLNLPFSIAPGGSVEVTVRFRPPYLTSGIGAQSGVITIESNDPARPRVDIPTSGTGQGALIGGPSSVSFGSVPACSAVTTTVTLNNTGNTSLVIGGIYTLNPAFNLVTPPSTPFTITPGSSRTLTLSFTPLTAGPQNGSLVVSSNAVNFPGLRIPLNGTGTAATPPSISSISVSRTTLAHGRADNTRATTPFNSGGLISVIGFAFSGGPLPPNSIAPGVIPPPLINPFIGLPGAAISSAPNPLRITLAGGAANPIVVSAANIPSCFTLAVAEGLGPMDLTRWVRVGTRFGSGNLYASVSIPGTSIVAGQELVTEADLDAYTANSIIYEAPDFGLLVAPAGQNGGTATLSAMARRIPSVTQCQTASSQLLSTQVEYSRTVRIEILENETVIRRVPGGIDVTITAQISGNFDPAINTRLRFGVDRQGIDTLRVIDDPSGPTGPRRITETFGFSEVELCKLVQFTVVATSTGNFPFAPPPLDPFLAPLVPPIGLFTFRSAGCTVEDTKTVLLRPPDGNCGTGIPVGWIRGRVTDLATNEPIVGATVSVVGTNLTTMTGFDGNYELNEVPAGQQTVRATADGFAPSEAPVNVVAGLVQTRDLILRPLTGTVRGIVFDDVTRMPIAGAFVEAKGTGGGVSSGSDGSYTLINVPIGPQTIEASAANYLSDSDTVNVISAVTVPQDFFLTPTVGTVTGSVRNATNTALPIVGATVTVGGLSTTTDGGGNFSLSNIPVGPQTLTATAPDFNSNSVSVTVLAGMTVTQSITLQPQLGTVTGSIKDDFGEPVAGATVTIAGITTTSGADGGYTISNLPTGQQTITASKTDFNSATATVTVVGNQTTPQDLTLVRKTGTIKGRITNTDTNQPILTAEVELLPFPLSFANTNANGDYTLSNVPTGTVVILASAPGYYGKIGVVNVTADQTSTQDFALKRQVGTVTGLIFDNQSNPVSNAVILVSGASGTGTSATSGADGRYTLTNVPVGTQTLEVLPQPPYRQATATVNVVVNETIYKDIYLQTPTGSVTGTVRNASNNQPISGASILVGIPLGAVYYSAITNSSGQYTLNDIPAGSLTIYAGADGFMFGQKTTTVVVNQTSTVDFSLVPDTPANTTGTITGVVRSTAQGTPAVSGATVTVSGTNLSTTSAADGSYTLSNVPAGAQTLNISKSGFGSTTVQVTVNAGQTVTQNISLSPSVGTVTGTVLNASNAQPLSGATVSVNGTSLTTTTAANGSYTLSNVPTGSQTLNVSATGFISSSASVTVNNGQTATLNFTLSPTLPQGETRITLNWNKYDEGTKPRDLDMHLLGPNPDGTTCFHVAYTNRGSLSAAPFAQLEVDNISISGAPPTETIRIAKLTPGIYRLYINNFSNEAPNGLSLSNARINLVGALSGSFTVPSGTGRDWSVLEINGTTGAITTINQLASPPSNVCR